MKYYAIGMILLTILSVNDVTDTAFIWTDKGTARFTETESELAFCQPGDELNGSTAFNYKLLGTYEAASGNYRMNHDRLDSTTYIWQYRVADSDFAEDEAYTYLDGSEGKGLNIRRHNWSELMRNFYTQSTQRVSATNDPFEMQCELTAAYQLTNYPSCGEPTISSHEQVKTSPSLYLYPISGNYQLAEFTGKDGDQFELTDAELAANTLTIHQISDKMDFALDAPLDTANHRWLYEYFDEYGYDRTNHLEIQQSGVTASIDSFGVTSRFRMSGLNIEGNTFEEANLRLLITLEQNGQRLAMTIEDTPFSFVFERIGDAPDPSSSMNRVVTRR